VKSIKIKESGVYAPKDIEGIVYETDLGYPGSFPYTRGVYPSMYRARLWTMRQFAGFGLPEDTNRRFRKLWEEGETGFSTAFDMPTLLGYDSDDSHSLGEVGKGGVAIDTFEDMERLFRGIPIGDEKVSVSMTINAPACILLGMYYALGKKRRGVNPRNLRGTIQNDILKEFSAQNELIVPPDASMKIFVDTIEFCVNYMPNWNPVSISGYHMREKGSTAVQELAFTLADGIAYVKACVERGLNVDEFAPRFSFFFNVHNDFFEEIAKLRAARRIWARIMRYRFEAKNENSWKLRTHTQTSGVSLSWQQEDNNVVRATLQTLAAVLGGTQSHHTDGKDEQYSLPSEHAALLALRTQQIVSHESGVSEVVDPLAGSYFMEWLTRQMEEAALEEIERIDAMGGMVEAVKQRYPKLEIEHASLIHSRLVESGAEKVVGVNMFVDRNEKPKQIEFRGNPKAEKTQKERLERFRSKRDGNLVGKCLMDTKISARKGENIMPSIINAVEHGVTEGEIVNVLKDVHGEFIEG